jgi:hypothetical protein
MPHGARETGVFKELGGGVLKDWEGGSWRGLWGGFERGSSALEGIYSGCMGWVHAPPLLLAVPQIFL